MPLCPYDLMKSSEKDRLRQQLSAPSGDKNNDWLRKFQKFY